MSNLILSCHLGNNHEWDLPAEPFVLQRVIQAPELSTPVTLSYHIDNVTKLYEGDYTTVYCASLLGHESGELRNIVLKTDVDARYPRTVEYSQEALRYEKGLKQLQGSYIPRCYGLFQATMYNKLVSVLLLDDCGRSVNLRDDSLSYSEKTRIFKLFTKLHAAGFAHHDVDGRNIVKNKDGKFFLIDLEDSKPHTCGLRLYVLVGNFAPSKEEFGCSELHHVAMTLDFWVPEILKFYGYQVPVCKYMEGEAENLVGLLPDHMLRAVGAREEALQHAKNMITDVEEIQAHFAKVPDEKRYLHPSFYPKLQAHTEDFET